MKPSPHHLRRAWPLVVTCSLAVSAYFFGSGVSTLVATELVIEPPIAATHGAEGNAVDQLEPASGQAIRARNPFDSMTGPLGAEPVSEAAAEKPTRSVDPLAAPKCEGVRVDATTESSDPRWSMAVVQGPAEKHGVVRRVGQMVAGKLVAYIGFNPRERSPSVWLMNDGALCQSLLFDEAERAKPAPKPKLVPPKPPPRRGRRMPPPLPKAIGDKIRRLSATEYDIDRGVVDVVMRDYSKLVRGVSVKPVIERGKVAGLRLARTTPGSLLGRLGLRNGDVLKSINGFPLVSPDKALQAYARLRTASELRIEVVRRGKPTTIDLHIR